jgi:hypothetical protein
MVTPLPVIVVLVCAFANRISPPSSPEEKLDIRLVNATMLFDAVIFPVADKLPVTPVFCS